MRLCKDSILSRLISIISGVLQRESLKITNTFLCSSFPGGSEVKTSACNAEDLGSIPGLGRSAGEGNGSPFQYFYLENAMDGGAWWATVHGIAELYTTEHLHFTSFIQEFPGVLGALCQELQVKIKYNSYCDILI